MKKLFIAVVLGVFLSHSAESNIQYERDILPVLQAKCSACHSKTNDRPFFYNRWTKQYVEKKIHIALASFEIKPFLSGSDESSTRPYAEKLYRVIRNKKMPPAAYTVIHPGKQLNTEEGKLISVWALQLGP